MYRIIPEIMKHSDNEQRRKKVNRTSIWIAIGAIILIILLIVWLTMADLWGDTDVAAAILPRF